MTYEGFLDRLRKTPRTWRLVSVGGQRLAAVQGRGLIRCGEHDATQQCPMSAVAGVKIAPANDLAGHLGLPLDVAKDIEHAADNDDPLLLKARKRPRMLEVRQDLLEACGLKGGR